MKELVNVAYESVKGNILEIVNNNFGDGHLVLVGGLRPILLLTLRLLTLLESNFVGNPLWAWEFHPLELRLCLGQTL